MQKLRGDLAFKIESILAEGPLWHPTQQKLHWVDIEKMELHSLDPKTNVHTRFHTGKRIGCVVPSNDGRLVLALQGEIVEYDCVTNDVQKLIDLEPGKPNNRSNDGKCDSRGRLWLGTMDLHFKPGEGTLYCLDKDLKVSTMLSNLTISNGMGWSLAGDEMYFIDSPDQCVKCFQIDAGRPTLRNGKPIVQVNYKNEFPDGMCVDDEGMIWVAFWGGSRVGRYDPKAGAQLAEVEVPAPHVTSCCFGGPDLRTLYVTTAMQGLSSQQLADFPLSGSIFSCRPGVSGAPPNFFNA
jgi:sugar lactone lactonase YvrE